MSYLLRFDFTVVSMLIFLPILLSLLPLSFEFICFECPVLSSSDLIMTSQPKSVAWCYYSISFSLFLRKFLLLTHFRPTLLGIFLLPPFCPVADQASPAQPCHRDFDKDSFLSFFLPGIFRSQLFSSSRRLIISIVFSSFIWVLKFCSINRSCFIQKNRSQ